MSSVGTSLASSAGQVAPGARATQLSTAERGGPSSACIGQYGTGGCDLVSAARLGRLGFWYAPRVTSASTNAS